MPDLEQLAQRVEAASGPDRELDLDILDALPHLYQRARLAMVSITASLDAALTLKPEGWHVGMLTECDEDGLPHCCLTENEEPCRDAVGDGVNMTMSLIAAALRARAQMEGK